MRRHPPVDGRPELGGARPRTRVARRALERFNLAIRSGDWGPTLALFTADASLAFEGVAAGPFAGRDAIAAAYRDAPPDDEIVALAVAEPGADRTFVVDYAWAREPERRAGVMRLTPTADWTRIERLVVTFD